ncbi:ribbon-helix-helix domain-containing protein [Paracraurococcus lichenis]|uniref:ribbon-helix-helix domain-containing protein n=1 Tax=Paracraurococcus lichenis TaxID=3064888 RepID=UPI00351D7550
MFLFHPSCRIDFASWHNVTLSFVPPWRLTVQTRTVKLTERLNAFIEEAVASGRYLDDGDVVREALRLLALREWEDGTAPASAPLPAGATAPKAA